MFNVFLTTPKFLNCTRSNCTYFIFTCYFLPVVHKLQTGLVKEMTTMFFHQTYVTQWQSLFTFISSFAIVFLFILTSTDNWLLFSMMFLHCFCLLAESNETINHYHSSELATAAMCHLIICNKDKKLVTRSLFQELRKAIDYVDRITSRIVFLGSQRTRLSFLLLL